MQTSSLTSAHLFEPRSQHGLSVPCLEIGWAPKVLWKICCLELESLEHILPLKKYCAWLLGPQPSPQEAQ